MVQKSEKHTESSRNLQDDFIENPQEAGEIRSDVLQLCLLSELARWELWPPWDAVFRKDFTPKNNTPLPLSLVTFLVTSFGDILLFALMLGVFEVLSWTMNL